MRTFREPYPYRQVWSAAALCRFERPESARGLEHSKTLTRSIASAILDESRKTPFSNSPLLGIAGEAAVFLESKEKLKDQHDFRIGFVRCPFCREPRHSYYSILRLLGDFVICAKQAHRFLAISILQRIGNVRIPGWFRRVDIVNGGTIELQMGNVPNTTLGSQPSALPPSSIELDPTTLTIPTAK